MPEIASALRSALPNLEVFDDWYAAGPIADDSWQEYEKNKGVGYDVALRSYAAQHVFQFDRFHLDRASMGLLVMPAGKSGHLELGYLIGQGKPGFVLFDKEPERWDVMYGFAYVLFSLEDLIRNIQYYI